MASLYYQGHGSYRISSDDGRIIYIDPYAGDGYDLPADIILVTHQHGDHNQIKLCKQNEGCRIITNEEALEGGTHRRFDIDGIELEAVEAANKNHDSRKCVGYIITVDGVKIYASGDTSKTEKMQSFAAMKLDYALFPCDGIYNMGFDEAAECAGLINARHNIPIHMKPGELYDENRARKWNAPNCLIVLPGDKIPLQCACE